MAIILNIFSIVKEKSMLNFVQKENNTMISYQPLFETMYRKNVSEYSLIFKYGVPANTLHRIKHGEAITTKTLNTLCEILDCSVSEILEYIPPEKI